MNTVKEIYLDGNYNCCETTIRLANEKYRLGLTEDNMKLVAGFGGGLGCGLACGVLCGGVAAISQVLVETKGHECPQLKEALTGFVGDFKEKLGAVNCSELKVIYVDPEKKELRCSACVEKGWAVLQEHMDKLQENK